MENKFYLEEKMNVKFTDKYVIIDQKQYRFYRDIPVIIFNALDQRQQDLIKYYFSLR